MGSMHNGDDKDAGLRKGKWVQEEEAYAARLIQLFNQGLLVLPEGMTLRSYLAEKLNCDPMRITKKFTGASCLGKRVFHSRKHTDASLAEMQNAQHELNCLETRFHSRLEHDRERSKEACMIDLEARFLNASNVVSSPAIDAFIMQSCANQSWTSKPEPNEDSFARAEGALPAPPPSTDYAAGSAVPPQAAHDPPAVPRAAQPYAWPTSGYPNAPQPGEATCVDASTSSWVSAAHLAAAQPVAPSIEHAAPPTAAPLDAMPASATHAMPASTAQHVQPASENESRLLMGFARSSLSTTCEDSGGPEPVVTNGCRRDEAASLEDDGGRRDPALCLPLDAGHNKRQRCDGELPSGYPPADA